jgi:putative membrane protein
MSASETLSELQIEQAAIHPAGNILLVAPLLLAYALARALEVTRNPIPQMDIVALDVLSALCFALIDGSRQFRLRGILVLAAICVVVGNLTENLSIATGFPFGHYYFVQLMGPKLFQVPILLGLAYIGMAYVSWMVAQAILGTSLQPAKGLRFFALPLLASLVMTAWDLAQDPVWATVLHGWVWRDGGAWFGVPVSNYLGWTGNLLVIYVLFALYLRRQPRFIGSANPARYWPALIFYSLCAAGNFLQSIPEPFPPVVQDPAGKLWHVSDITTASAIVSIFIMGGFVALGVIRIGRRTRLAKD